MRQTSRRFSDAKEDHQRATMVITRGRRTVSSILLVRDLVVAAPQKLDKTDAVSEWIGHVRDAAPIVDLNFTLRSCAALDGPVDGHFDIIDHEIEVYGRPVPTVATDIIRRDRRFCASVL